LARGRVTGDERGEIVRADPVAAGCPGSASV
jgi:hypothetical protein